MSTAKEVYLKIKGLFDAPAVIPPNAPVVSAVPAALMTPTPMPFKLMDGTDIMISIEDPMVSMMPDTGDMVTMAGVTADAGDYTLEDGSIITVDARGMITLIVAPMPITQPEFVAPPALTLEERINALEVKVNTPVIPTAFASQKETNDLSALIEKQNKVIAGLFDLVEKLVDEPTATPKTLSENQKAKFDRVNRKDERFKKIAEQIKTQKALS